MWCACDVDMRILDYVYTTHAKVVCMMCVRSYQSCCMVGHEEMCALHDIGVHDMINGHVAMSRQGCFLVERWRLLCTKLINQHYVDVATFLHQQLILDTITVTACTLCVLTAYGENTAQNGNPKSVTVTRSKVSHTAAQSFRK